MKDEKQKITEDFSATMDDLLDAVKGFERVDMEALKKNPADFLDLILTIMKEDSSLFPLVDKTHSLGAGFIPSDLVALGDLDIRINRNDMQLRKEAAVALEKMSQAAKQEGIILDVSSAYRSYAYQDYLYQASIDRIGQEATDRELAKPGTSQHQLGTTIDFGSVDASFANTKAYAWLKQHAGEYGFVISYPENDEQFTGYIFESWHYRYLGTAAARLCSGYFESSQHAMMLFLDARWARFMIWRASK